MIPSFQLHAVIEAPYFQDEFIFPWDTPVFDSSSRIRLSGEMTYPEIGLVFAQLARYNFERSDELFQKFDQCFRIGIKYTTIHV